MATIEQSKIVESCQKYFMDLEAQDGGYYPSKHDKKVFDFVAKEFGITEEEVLRVYDEYTKHAAEIEMEKIKKLPPALRKKAIQDKFSDILRNNRDLPYYKMEGAPKSDLEDPLKSLNDEYKSIIEKTANAGWTIPLNIDLHRFDELKKSVNDENTLDCFFVNYYAEREFKYICRKIFKSIQNQAQKSIFNECIFSYENGLYSTCLTTLITIFEGVVSSFGDSQQDVRVMRICRFHADEALKKKKYIKNLCWLSMYQYTSVLYQKSDFSQPEPTTINRHWIQHGRTGKEGDKISCLKVFNALSTMACMQVDSVTTK